MGNVYPRVKEVFGSCGGYLDLVLTAEGLRGHCMIASCVGNK